MLPDTIASNQAYTAKRLDEMRSALANQLHGSAFCVVVTGSFGRHEASEQSDLDYFIIGREVDRDLAPHRDVSKILGAMVTKKAARMIAVMRNCVHCWMRENSFRVS